MANLSIVLNITSPASTSLTLTPSAPFTGSGTSFSAPGPVASGTTVGTISVAPAGWSGALALSGAQAALFTLNGFTLVTAAQLNSGTTDNVTITATP